MRNDNIITPYLIEAETPLLKALEALNRLSGGRMTLFAIDKMGKLAGTITDGDIRRALLNGKSLESKVEDVMNKKYLAIYSKEEFDTKTAEALSRGIMLLPVVEGGAITEIIDIGKARVSLPIDAVLMAGGRGERLRPLTDSVPKPLLEVGQKAVIDYNVEALEKFGVRNIFVTVNYLAEKIENHFESYGGFAEIKCIREPRRLGTIGSLSLVEGLEHDNILVMNSDLLTEIDFQAFYQRHLKEGFDLTVGSIPYIVSVPYAVMNIEGNLLKGLQEKPTFNYLANAGVYLMRRKLIERIPKGEYVDAPDFIEDMIRQGYKVGTFTIEGRWIDIGSPEDYRYAQNLFS